MKNNKLLTYLGFARKSGNLIYGIDNIEHYKKEIYVVLIDATLSENGRKQLIKVCLSKSISIYQLTDISLDELINTNNCKIVGIIDFNLASAVTGLAGEINKIS